MKTITETGIEMLKSLALMDHLEEPYVEHEGTYYTGAEYDEDSIEVEEYDEENYDNKYIVLTDEEADEKARESITESLWAFNPSFLASMTDFDVEVFEAIAANEKCESNNNVIYNTIQRTCGIKTFVAASSKRN